MTYDRRRLRATGVVQGVGFRPHVYRLAHELALSGFVGNDSAGVVAELEGDADDLDRFVRRLLDEPPPLARIDSIEIDDIEVRRESGFEIVSSTVGKGPRTFVPPDVATCDECLADVHDPSDRRFRYPFTNCTNCGPRFTIIRDLPYDRPATTMASFEMCPACEREYHDPTDRRHHAQPIACPACGPQLRFVSSTAEVGGTDASLAAVQRELASGRIVAIKGIGGYHLACDASDDAAVVLLRRRKGRGDKPFAVMLPDLASVRRVADVGDGEAAALTDPARPIVLLRRAVPDASGMVSAAVAPGSPLIGVMLPYTPLHPLLFEPVPGSEVDPPAAIVLTSGNRADEPICFDDVDARDRLRDLADAFCWHDRGIEVPCDDSVVRVVAGTTMPIRRSRGYAPLPIRLGTEVAPVIATGGELKNTCCVAAGSTAWMGQHIGDMEHLETVEAFAASVEAFSRMYEIDPAIVGADLHPGYATRRWAVAGSHVGGPEVHGIQHHHAHVASLIAEHGLASDEPVLGFAFDGTGYGVAPDGGAEIWGGEVLLADAFGYERVTHLAALPLPGGDAAVRAPCRLAVAQLGALGIPLDPAIPAVAACEPYELDVVLQQVQGDIRCAPTTSMGRCFDVVASLLGIRHRISYEAQAAIELEAIAERGRPDACVLAFSLHDGVIDQRPVLAGVVEGVLAGVPVADLALAFHVAVADAISAIARTATWPPDRKRRVGLTGGVFQNALLTRLAVERLTAAGLDVLTHRLVPPNDGGLALGQALIAGVAARGGG